MKRNLKTVLYVDDEPDIREVAEMALTLVPDLAVHLSESGEQALATLPALKPDLVLLDVMMPGVDGPTTLARMRTQPGLRDIPVVFITAKALPHEIQRFRELGAVGVISKPFDALRLGSQILEIWEELSGRA